MAATQKTKKKPARPTDRRNIWLLIITTLLVLGSVFMFTPPQEKINQGLDIQGGLSVVLTAKSTDGQAVSNDDMEKSRAIIESRVNALGASEAVVQVQGTDQILVQIPGLTNTEDALNTIGKTGKLEFARLDSFTDEDVKTKIENGQASGEGTVSDDLGVATLPTGETQHLKVEDGTYTPIVTGSNITKVDIGKRSDTSTDYAVNISLDSAGAAAFAEASKDLAPTKGKIVIILDNEVQSAPATQSEIPDGNIQITGNYSLDEAKALQTVLESGSLPVSFEYAQSQTVGPTLGQDALASGVLVALIGLAVVMLYLLFFYRGLGAITAAAMIVFAVLYLGILATLSSFGLFSLSLAGIAGIVLTIGMAADSSILTMERFREEIRMGRSVRAASVTGVKHAIVTSIDADLVTLVSALSLFFLASASVKGFGLTLALGIACDIAMMLLFKAPLIRLLAPKVIARHPGFWGIKDSLAASKDYAALAAAEGTSTAAAEAGEAINAAESEEAAQRA
ncbi:protein translocase subunit SecD, partial [Eggerthella lenta]|uniref:protein translocase subunit SecD n=1 Tax=Eggerthella lenta TaxID=84112 RepID=UPI0032C1E43D